ncbi:MAG: LytR/AlgR family response regulator transcription factor [bacterium]
MIRTLIVDDEPLARERIRKLLENEPDFEVIGECTHGKEAVSAIRRDPPDLLFLDVQMPELDGFRVLERLRLPHMPAVIFVTAYDRYALKAFEVYALDYLLKPFDRSRFRKALARAKTQIGQDQTGSMNRKLLALLEDLKKDGSQPGGKRYLERLVIRASGRIYFIKIEEIDWFEAAGNYVRLHVGMESHLLRDTMSEMEAKLDPARFLRIHRSTIVNTDRIKEMNTWFNGEYVLILKDGTRLNSSRGYRDKLGAFLANG